MSALEPYKRYRKRHRPRPRSLTLRSQPPKPLCNAILFLLEVSPRSRFLKTCKSDKSARQDATRKSLVRQ